MTEEFIFKKVGRNRAAVERYERFVRPRAPVVDGARAQLFTCPGGAYQQSCRVARCYVRDPFDRSQKARGAADELLSGKLREQVLPGFPGIASTAAEDVPAADLLASASQPR
jgi:hypothetical protein